MKYVAEHVHTRSAALQGFAHIPLRGTSCHAFMLAVIEEEFSEKAQIVDNFRTTRGDCYDLNDKCFHLNRIFEYLRKKSPDNLPKENN